MKELLRMQILRIDLLEIAKRAWKRGQELPRSFDCQKASTINGFREYFNQIQIVLNGTNGNHNPTTFKDGSPLLKVKIL